MPPNFKLVSQIEYPRGHIYSAIDLPEYYDYYLWRYIEYIVRRSSHEHALVDVGANVGDSAAIWRSMFGSKIICIEPNEIFFGYLQRNALKIKNCTLIKSLYSAGLPKERLLFKSTGYQTGTTEVLEPDPINAIEPQQDYAIITIEELLDYCEGSPAVLKADTDGFDLNLITDLLDSLGPYLRNHFPVIFSEGPTQQEYTLEATIQRWLHEIQRLMSLGYNLMIFANSGHPYAYCGANLDMARSCFFHYRNQLITEGDSAIILILAFQLPPLILISAN